MSIDHQNPIHTFWVELFRVGISHIEISHIWHSQYQPMPYLLSRAKLFQKYCVSQFYLQEYSTPITKIGQLMIIVTSKSITRHRLQHTSNNTAAVFSLCPWSLCRCNDICTTVLSAHVTCVFCRSSQCTNELAGWQSHDMCFLCGLCHATVKLCSLCQRIIRGFRITEESVQ
jgi:hypothetical protein